MDPTAPRLARFILSVFPYIGRLPRGLELALIDVVVSIVRSDMAERSTERKRTRGKPERYLRNVSHLIH
jgi:hypothetical protein